MFDADQIIFEAVWDSLPNCALCRRRALLQALRAKMSHRHPAFKNVSAQLAMLDGLDKLQSELPFKKGSL